MNIKTNPKNPDIYTQLFDDNTDLNNSYPNIDQEFANIPDVDELIEISELDREKIMTIVDEKKGAYFDSFIFF